MFGDFFPLGFIKKEKNLQFGQKDLTCLTETAFLFWPQAFTAVKECELEKENKSSGLKILCIVIPLISEIFGLSSGFVKLMVKLPQAGIQF